MRYILDRNLAARCRRCLHRRRGQALVEFAIISFVLYFLFAGILTFGSLLYCAQSLQPAADTAASEIARFPLPATATATTGGLLYDILYCPASQATAYFGSSTNYNQFRSQVFDQQYLYVSLSSAPTGTTFADWIKTWPVVNQMLVPLMVTELDDNGNPAYLWYPGAIQGTDSNGWTVFGIALVTGRQTGGAENIEWVPVIEPATTDPGGLDAFDVQSTYRGLVSLQINYPYQSATMSAYPQTWPPGPTGTWPPAYQAQDGSVSVAQSPAFTFTPASSGAGPADPTYSGQYGLGGQQAYDTTVRPFRRTLSAQAVARREVFQ